MISAKSEDDGMGGRGSGRRWRYDAHNTTSDYRALDVRRWQRDGLLTTPGRSFGWQWTHGTEVAAAIQVRAEVGRVILIYRYRRGGGDWKDEIYPVGLDWTPCHLGGQRPWFRCPAQGCARRVALLYLGGSGIFACRHCYRLAYVSQRERASGRVFRRADRIRSRLGWPIGVANPCGCKPMGMHWSTYERLVEQHDALAGIAMAGLAQRFEPLKQRFDALWDALHGQD
jgi:hypothetical protein